jgi:ABC-type nickel/cobalt efflux system permease component RcnA
MFFLKRKKMSWETDGARSLLYLLLFIGYLMMSFHHREKGEHQHGFLYVVVSLLVLCLAATYLVDGIRHATTKQAKHGTTKHATTQDDDDDEKWDESVNAIRRKHRHFMASAFSP